MATGARNERIDLRVESEQKKLIERAAVLSGQTVSTFMLGSAIRQAQEVIRNAEVIDLTNRERDLLLAALDDTGAQPNAALLRSAERSRALIGWIAVPEWKTERLAEHHDRDGFDCGNPILSDWFKQQSSQFERKDLARTYVLVSASQPSLVAGYYSISTCQIRYEDLPPIHSKGLPRHLIIPAALLGKLAIDQRFQGQGLGSALLGNALRRMLHLASVIGIRVVVVDAIDDAAGSFYLKQGFTPMPDRTGRLFISIRVIRGLGLEPLSD
jgi:uncharacterized protein (DUF1778 family)/predicted GNAT family N-acyltransferase